MEFLKLFALTIILPINILSQQNFGFTTTQVNFRNGPGKEFQVISVFPVNKKIEIISIVPTKDFIHVKEIETNKSGYIHKSFISIESAISTKQSESNLTNQNHQFAKTEEIIHWLNDFEDRNSPERIMQGTLQDKVNIQFENGILEINSMIMRMMSPSPLMIQEDIILVDVIRVEALKSIKDNYTFVDFAIYTKEGSISMQCKEMSDPNYTECPWSDKYFKEKGYVSKNLRFKFPNNIAEKEIDRVYKALTELFNSQGVYPKFGSLF